MLYKFVKVVLKALLTLLFRIKAVGKENVIDGGVILAANHKSNWDPLCIIATCPRQLASMSKKELFKFKPLGWILKKVGAFPVNRGKGDIGAVKTALAILKQEKPMMMFPEGRRILDGTRGEAKAGVAMLAHRAQVPVLPIKICGKFRLFSKITVIYGEPVYFDEYYGEKLSVEKMQELSESVMDKVYSLDE
jgi:1-acyl-sn-glycerol-3-phosphate acyltransferase